MEKKEVKVLVHASGRHVHLSEADLKTLFGPEAEISCVIADKNVKITEGCTLVASGRYPMALAKDSEV